ncbi:hypothetical protein GJ688_06850 [Heliobacillus mobilis]|uniref:Flagellar protein FlgJ N-terminal domain-containing protein n=1 Tax=Heliobacterium mobile TaxID=28064 RepID=A0A6I3SIQ8_HELMO|nr:rod-binding protein [Heliobacterium mobile]MTV48696.1 hypothetical protein [Heliobacterium mobile]
MLSPIQIAGGLLSADNNQKKASSLTSANPAGGQGFQNLLEESVKKKAEELNKESTGSITEEEKAKKQKQLRELCQEFESVFIYQMFKGMRSTVMKSDFVEAAPGRDIWEDMRDQEYAKQMAKREDMGLAKMLYTELSRSLK